MGVKFQEADVSVDQAAAEEMVNVSGQMGVPVIVMGGEVIVGFDRRRIQELLAGAKPQASAPASDRIRFGLKIADAQKMAEKAGGVAVLGALVGEVSPDGVGYKAGLHAGDIITRINDKVIAGVADMEGVAGTLKTGDILTILFLRNGTPGKSEIVI
jgi:S1-C subfamily serine protease